MRGVVFVGDRELELREFPDPVPGPGEVVLRMTINRSEAMNALDFAVNDELIEVWKRVRDDAVIPTAFKMWELIWGGIRRPADRSGPR